MRRTIVVHTRLAGHMVRVEGARAGAQGLQILTMGQLAARLAGGFLSPIDQDSLREVVRDALADTDLGELENIKSSVLASPAFRPRGRRSGRLGRRSPIGSRLARRQAHRSPPDGSEFDTTDALFLRYPPT